MPVALRAGASHFRVRELPAYEPCGDGEHLWVEVEKRNLATDRAARALAEACGRPLSDVGFAGRKDRHAIARKVFSVRGAREDDLTRLTLPADAELEICATSRHTNKLRLGHLRGNRFELDLQGLGSTERGSLHAELERIAREGLTHRFGPQRFGHAGHTLELARRWGRDGRRPPGAPDRKLVASAAQAAVFNAVLDARAAAGLLHRLRPGDLAVGRGGRPFRCESDELEALNRRAAPGALEVRASAPLPGHRVPRPSAEIDAQERDWARPADVDWDWFEKGAPLGSPGERRPLLVPLLEAPRLGEASAEHAVLHVALPPGAFATELLAQLGVEVPDSRSGGDAP